MDNSPGVGELKSPAGFLGYVDGLLQGKAVVGGVFDDTFNVSTAHQFGHPDGLAIVFTQVEDGDNVGMGAQPTHGLGFSGDAGARDVVQALGLDQGEGYVPVQQGISGQEPRDCTTPSKGFLHPVP